jgi:hypothetical protein
MLLQILREPVLDAAQTLLAQFGMATTRETVTLALEPHKEENFRIKLSRACSISSQGDWPATSRL